MEPAGQLSLPVEILHNISQYFTVKDVLNCSQTCHYLRMAFNYDRVWRRFVPEKVLLLEEEEQVLEPAFQWEDIFTPLCDYRLHYMRLTHLLNNWKNFNFVKLSVETEHSYASSVFDVPKGRGKAFYKDRYLFLGRFTNDIESDGIEVWDVGNKEPVQHSFLDIKNINYEHFYIIDSNLVVVVCQMVCVYQINLPEKSLSLLYSFLTTQTDVIWNEEAEHSGRCDFGCVGWSYYNIGQYLVSNKCGYENEEGNIIHVWDICNATKVGAFTLPVDGFSVSVESHDGDEWLLRETLLSFSDKLYFLLNIKEKTVTKTAFRFDDYAKLIILYQSHILVFRYDVNGPNSEGWFDIICIVYDLKTSEEIQKRCFKTNSYEMNSLFGSTAIVNGSFLFLSDDGFQKIDALTLETMDHFECDVDVRFNVHQFNVFGNTLYVVASGRVKRLFVWNFAKKEELTMPLELDYASHLHLNDTMTRLVILDYRKINVLHFW